ncbi:MAG TPA: tetratricopeptide repeat protein [Gemmatimonadales bacterium]
MTSPDAVLRTATSATRQGALDQADRLAHEALGGFRLRVDDDGRMRALNLLGAIAFERGDTALAADRFAGALEIARSLGDHLLGARALNNLASVTHLRGEVDAALALYREALLTYQRLGDRRGSAETWHNIALVYREAGRLDEAEGAANHAVRHAGLTMESGLLGLVLTGRAEVALARGDAALSAEALDRADALAVEAGDRPGRAEILRIRALLALHGGDGERARQLAVAARDEARALGAALLQAESAGILAKALRESGQEDEAGAMREEARRLFESLGATAHLARLTSAS